MKRNLLLSGILSLAAACATAPSAEQASAKARYADALMAIVPPETMLAQLADPYAAGYAQAGGRDKARANFMRNIDRSAVNRIIRDALLKHFTEAELQALATFYGTPEGRACMTKVAPFAAEVVPACSLEATRAFGKTAREAAQGLLLP